MGIPAGAAEGAPLGRAVSGAGGTAESPLTGFAPSEAPDPSPRPLGSQESAPDGSTATTATAAATNTPTTLQRPRPRRPEARLFTSCGAGPVRHPSGRAGGAADAFRPQRRFPPPPALACASSMARSRSVTIRARADGSSGAEARMFRSLSSTNLAHTSSGREEESGSVGSSDDCSGTGWRTSCQGTPAPAEGDAEGERTPERIIPIE
ncbi:hypothetical protein CP972_21815 [Streptomyces prasinus]|uniref:Uncharacterized protein n=1 Tax=Streptomyces prasinus TaxID=67345 RepID=A0ABX6B0R7_9ACTN|nr:hypothetical protein CP972_21815 [Streptomyces prasinus]